MFFQYLYESENLPLTRGKSYRKAVRAVIMKNGQLLMLRTIHGDFKFPGGGVKKEEEDTVALKREVMEETGFGLSQVGACLGRVLERKEDDFWKIPPLRWSLCISSAARLWGAGCSGAGRV